MALELKLELSKSNFILLDEIEIKLQFRNTGRSPISIHPPGKTSSEPIFRVINLENFECMVYRTTTPDLTDRPVVLDSGQTMQCSLPFKSIVNLEVPGSYEFNAEYFWNSGDFMARSNTVTFTIYSIDILASAITRTHLCQPGTFSVYWTIPRRKHALLNRATITQSHPPGFAALLEIGKFAPDAFPVPAIGTAESPTHSGDMLVWLVNNVLHCTRINPDGSQSLTNSFRLPELPIALLGSPVQIPAGPSELVIWLGTPDASNSKMQLAIIDATGNLAAGASVQLGPGAPPVWSHTLPGPDNRSSLHLVQQRDESFELKALYWQNRHFSAPYITRAIRGRFMAADVRINSHGHVLGTLLNADPAKPNEIGLTCWSESIDSDPVFAAAESIPLNPEAVESFHLGITPSGAPIILIKSEGRWVLYQDGQISAVSSSLESLDNRGMIFISDDQIPNIIYPHPLRGFDIISLEDSSHG